MKVKQQLKIFPNQFPLPALLMPEDETAADPDEGWVVVVVVVVVDVACGKKYVLFPFDVIVKPVYVHKLNP